MALTKKTIRSAILQAIGDRLTHDKYEAYEDEGLQIWRKELRPGRYIALAMQDEPVDGIVKGSRRFRFTFIASDDKDVLYSGYRDEFRPPRKLQRKLERKIIGNDGPVLEILRFLVKDAWLYASNDTEAIEAMNYSKNELFAELLSKEKKYHETEIRG